MRWKTQRREPESTWRMQRILVTGRQPWSVTDPQPARYYMVPAGSRQGTPMSEIAPGRIANGTSGPPAAPQRDEPERTSDAADTETVLVTDSDLAHARQDPAFRHQLVAHSLEL